MPELNIFIALRIERFQTIINLLSAKLNKITFNVTKCVKSKTPCFYDLDLQRAADKLYSNIRHSLEASPRPPSGAGQRPVHGHGWRLY